MSESRLERRIAYRIDEARRYSQGARPLARKIANYLARLSVAEFVELTAEHDECEARR